MIRGNILATALMHAIAYGFYTYVIVLTANALLSTDFKILITALCNFACVGGVMLIENKLRKDRLWKIEFTIATNNTNFIDQKLDHLEIPHRWITLSNKHTSFVCYCNNRQDSNLVKNIIKTYDAKWFVTESKTLF